MMACRGKYTIRIDWPIVEMLCARHVNQHIAEGDQGRDRIRNLPEVDLALDVVTGTVFRRLGAIDTEIPTPKGQRACTCPHVRAITIHVDALTRGSPRGE